MTKSAAYIIESLYQHFMQVYAQWPEKRSMALARKTLEKDITLLGLYFGKVDEFGQMVELTLVAECIAYLRICDNPLDQRKMIDYWTDIAMEELQSQQLTASELAQTMKDIVEQLESWNLTRTLFMQSLISQELLQSMFIGFIELADIFFMRDGNITSEELQAMREFEEALGFKK